MLVRLPLLVGLVPLHRRGPGTDDGRHVGLTAVQPTRQRFGAFHVPLAESHVPISDDL